MERKKIRKPVFAGSFYPEDAETLRFMIEQYMDAADSDLGRCNLKALISPHAGYVYSGDTAGYTYRLLRQYAEKNNRKQKVFIIGPSHTMQLNGFALSSFNAWHTPLGEVQVSEINEKLAAEDCCEVYDQAYGQEHCIEVQLPFLQQALKGDQFEIVPMLCSEFKDSGMLKVLKKYFDKNSLLIVSTDLSHYLDYEQAQGVDNKTIQAIEKKDDAQLAELGDACGLCGVRLAVKLANKKRWKANIADYRTSGDTAGSKDAVVGYLSAYFCK
jgi:hypothetical protein